MHNRVKVAEGFILQTPQDRSLQTGLLSSLDVLQLSAFE